MQDRRVISLRIQFFLSLCFSRAPNSSDLASPGPGGSTCAIKGTASNGHHTIQSCRGTGFPTADTHRGCSSSVPMHDCGGILQGRTGVLEQV